MDITVIVVESKYTVVEFSDGHGHIQRRKIPHSLHPLYIRGPATLDDDIVYMGLEYSNVDLVSTLGSELPAILVSDLEDALRRAGLWTQQDYRSNPGIIAGVLQKLRKADVTSVLNAAHTKPG